MKLDISVDNEATAQEIMDTIFVSMLKTRREVFMNSKELLVYREDIKAIKKLIKSSNTLLEHYGVHYPKKDWSDL
jgi:hypothetical protein